MNAEVCGSWREDSMSAPAADPENASPFLSGDVGSDMHNATSVLMYAAEMCGSEIPEEEGKGNGELQRRQPCGKALRFHSHGS